MVVGKKRNIDEKSEIKTQKKNHKNRQNRMTIRPQYITLSTSIGITDFNHNFNYFLRIVVKCGSEKTLKIRLTSIEV